MCNSSLILSSMVNSTLCPTPCTACTLSFISYPVSLFFTLYYVYYTVIHCCYSQIYGIHSPCNLYLVIHVFFCQLCYILSLYSLFYVNYLLPYHPWCTISFSCTTCTIILTSYSVIPSTSCIVLFLSASYSAQCYQF